MDFTPENLITGEIHMEKRFDFEHCVEGGCWKSFFSLTVFSCVEKNCFAFRNSEGWLSLPFSLSPQLVFSYKN